MTVELVYSAEEFSRDEASGQTSRTGQRYTLRFDAVTREGHLVQSSLTEHAVEKGAAIADHKIPEAQTFSLSCIVSDRPLGDAPPSGSRTKNVTGRLELVDVGNGETSQGLVYSEPVTRTVDVFAELRDLCRRPVSVSIRTGLQVYTDMQVISVSAPRTVQDGNALEFGIEFRELRTSTVETTTAPRPRYPRNKGRANRGAQANVEPEAEKKEAAKRSVLSSIFGGGS